MGCSTAKPGAKLSAIPRLCFSPLDAVRDDGSTSPSPASPAVPLAKAGAGCAWQGALGRELAKAELLLPVPPAQRGTRGGNCR